MNWVPTNSLTSGNKRLVLLAMANACSRDDGTGCWPSAATIARKANISDPNVESLGHAQRRGGSAEAPLRRMGRIGGGR
jgi:hypothetical protein